MRIARVDVDLGKEVLVHVEPVAVRTAGREPHVFVEIERAAEGEIQVLFPMLADQLGINSLHRPAGGQPQHQERVGPHLVGDDSRRQVRGRSGILSYDDFHSADYSMAQW